MGADVGGGGQARARREGLLQHPGPEHGVAGLAQVRRRPLGPRPEVGRAGGGGSGQLALGGAGGEGLRGGGGH